MSNVLFILTGSIACYKACEVISQLVQRGHSVRCVATESALKFVGRSTLEGLTRREVATDLFAPGEALDHINLSRWAELTIVCPATADRLNRLAGGLGEDLAGALLLAHEWRKPLLVAPAMNPAMWRHPATAAAVEKLREWGAIFVAPGAGRTACGEVGEGRLAEPDEIVAAIEAKLSAPPRRLRVLITSGGTSEPIDGVRVLTNTSTGATGAEIARYFAQSGHEVLLVRAATATAVPGVAEETFTTFNDLQALLGRRLREQDFDVVIHAAAVSDFSVRSIEVDGTAWRPGSGKIPSGGAPVIRLQRNPKLLDGLRAMSRNAEIRIVAFKLTRDADAATARVAVQKLFAANAADFVVHNDVAGRASGGAFPADVWAANGSIVEHCADRADIGPAIESLLLAPEAPAPVP